VAPPAQKLVDERPLWVLIYLNSPATLRITYLTLSITDHLDYPIP
jgi:hypothetical protein